MLFIPYNTNLKDYARQLRSNSTYGEIILWKQLRAGNIKGYNFNRQKTLGNYIVDFYCKKLNLVIEIDGKYHFEKQQIIKDKQREDILKKMGLQLVRFDEKDIHKNLQAVLNEIENYINAYKNNKS